MNRRLWFGTYPVTNWMMKELQSCWTWGCSVRLRVIMVKHRPSLLTHGKVVGSCYKVMFTSPQNFCIIVCIIKFETFWNYSIESSLPCSCNFEKRYNFITLPIPTNNLNTVVTQSYPSQIWPEMGMCIDRPQSKRYMTYQLELSGLIVNTLRSNKL